MSSKNETPDDAARQALIAKLDKELDESIGRGSEKPEKSPNLNKYKVDFDQLVEDLEANPFFRNRPLEPGEPVPQMYQTVLDWMEEPEDMEETALEHKKKGNLNFKCKKYHWATTNYTDGIKCKCPNMEVNSILYANRAAAQARLGNHRSAFKDCVLSRKFKPDHMKAIMRGAECSMHLDCYDTAVQWCDSGLLLDPKDAEFQELRTKCVQKKKAKEKEDRRIALKEKKQLKEDTDLINAITIRGVTIDYDSTEDDSDKALVTPLMLASLDSHHPSGAIVHLNPDGTLTWPVMFFYPEVKQTEFIEEFQEDQRLIDHISHMFSEDTEPPLWDKERKYTPTSINIYFEDSDKEKETLHLVKKKSTLKSALLRDGYMVKGGTPGFILLVEGSEFAKNFLSKYTVK